MGPCLADIRPRRPRRQVAVSFPSPPEPFEFAYRPILPFSKFLIRPKHRAPEIHAGFVEWAYTDPSDGSYGNPISYVMAVYLSPVEQLAAGCEFASYRAVCHGMSKHFPTLEEALNAVDLKLSTLNVKVV